MATQQNIAQRLEVKFRVLIIGRANAGKTSILQRVCDTTESPEIYRLGPGGNRYQVQRDPTIERGQHEINDELIFTNHDGYIFHDSRGFEAGSKGELETVQEFVKRKSRKNRLKDRLHAIWYLVPMDNDRPSLDLKYFEAICPDKNVLVIAVFTKFDQFKRNIKMKLQDEGRDPEMDLNAEVENIFNQHYMAKLNGPPPFIRLEKMHKSGQQCAGLLEMTANALSDSAVTLMLRAFKLRSPTTDNRSWLGKRISLKVKGVLHRAADTVTYQSEVTAEGAVVLGSGILGVLTRQSFRSPASTSTDLSAFSSPATSPVSVCSESEVYGAPSVVEEWI